MDCSFKMKKIFILLTLLLSISLISSYYAGDSDIFNNTLGDNLVWTIIDNSSILSILPIIEINSTHIKVFFPYNMPPDNFTIVFLEESTKTVVQTINVGGGGSSRTKYITKIEYKEIPNYITEYINQTIEKEVPKEIEIIKNKVPLWIFIFFFLCTLLVVILLWKLYSKENYIQLEGGIENE